jgi:hypothetical protein
MQCSSSIQVVLRKTSGGLDGVGFVADTDSLALGRRGMPAPNQQHFVPKMVAKGLAAIGGRLRAFRHKAVYLAHQPGDDAVRVVDGVVIAEAERECIGDFIV